jgi:hypothetical protein
MLVYRCPATSKQVTTGIERTEHVLTRLRELKISVVCPYCVTGHIIRASEATIQFVKSAQRADAA